MQTMSLILCSGLVLLPLLPGALILVVTLVAHLQGAVNAPPAVVARLLLPAAGTTLHAKTIAVRETTIEGTVIAPVPRMIGIAR